MMTSFRVRYRVIANEQDIDTADPAQCNIRDNPRIDTLEHFRRDLRAEEVFMYCGIEDGRHQWQKVHADELQKPELQKQCPVLVLKAAAGVQTVAVAEQVRDVVEHVRDVVKTELASVKTELGTVKTALASIASVTSGLVLQVTCPPASQQSSEGNLDFKEKLKRYFRNHPDSTTRLMLCMATGKPVPEAAIRAAHIFSRGLQGMALVLGISDIDDEHNGVLWADAVHVAYKAHAVVIIPDEVVFPNKDVFRIRVIDTQWESELLTSHAKCRDAVYLNAIAGMTYGQLDGRELTFPSLQHVPYRRACLGAAKLAIINRKAANRLSSAMESWFHDLMLSPSMSPKAAARLRKWLKDADMPDETGEPGAQVNTLDNVLAADDLDFSLAPSGSGSMSASGSWCGSSMCGSSEHGSCDH